MNNTFLGLRKTGVIGTVVLMSLPLIALVYLFGGRFFDIFIYVLSGQLFASTWDPIHAGFALDQPTIGKFFFWFTVLAVFLLPYTAVVRNICAKRTLLQSGTFIIPTTILCLFLLCLLTIPFYWLIQYVDTMGYTPIRTIGLLYGIFGYIVVLSFFSWAIYILKIGSFYHHSETD